MGKEEYKCPGCGASIWNRNEFVTHAKKKHGLRIRQPSNHLAQTNLKHKERASHQA